MHIYDMKWLCLLLLTTATSCSVLQNNYLLYALSITMCDTAFVYSLPYQKGTSHVVVQGGHSLFSHKGYFAVDIKMAQGTKVLAARDGVVTFVRETYTAGGLGKKYAGKGNGITMHHSDGTFAHYWHLQYNGALVNVGDTVQQGQLIGLSGNTGFSAFPHLHFEVTEHSIKKEVSLPVLFKTEKGVKFLQPLRWYKAI